jgi:hypothetical protein
VLLLENEILSILEQAIIFKMVFRIYCVPSSVLGTMISNMKRISGLLCKKRAKVEKADRVFK